MEVLENLSREDFRNYCWGIAAAFLIVVGILRWRSLHWTAVGSILLFAALNAGAGLYILFNFGDSRWSPGSVPALSAPSFAGTPVVGEYLVPLDSALQDMVGGMNEVLAFKQALPVALEFIGMSGSALLVSVPVAVVAAFISFFVSRRRRADHEKYRATVDQLKGELEQIKLQMATGNFRVPAFRGDDTDVLPRQTRRS